MERTNSAAAAAAAPEHPPAADAAPEHPLIGTDTEPSLDLTSDESAATGSRTAEPAATNLITVELAASDSAHGTPLAGDDASPDHPPIAAAAPEHPFIGADTEPSLDLTSDEPAATATGSGTAEPAATNLITAELAVSDSALGTPLAGDDPAATDFGRYLDLLSTPHADFAAPAASGSIAPHHFPIDANPAPLVDLTSNECSATAEPAANNLITTDSTPDLLTGTTYPPPVGPVTAYNTALGDYMRNLTTFQGTLPLFYRPPVTTHEKTQTAYLTMLDYYHVVLATYQALVSAISQASPLRELDEHVADTPSELLEDNAGGAVVVEPAAEDVHHDNGHAGDAVGAEPGAEANAEVPQVYGPAIMIFEPIEPPPPYRPPPWVLGFKDSELSQDESRNRFPVRVKFPQYRVESEKVTNRTTNGGMTMEEFSNSILMTLVNNGWANPETRLIFRTDGNEDVPAGVRMAHVLDRDMDGSSGLCLTCYRLL